MANYMNDDMEYSFEAFSEVDGIISNAGLQNNLQFFDDSFMKPEDHNWLNETSSLDDNIVHFGNTYDPLNEFLHLGCTVDEGLLDGFNNLADEFGTPEMIISNKNENTSANDIKDLSEPNVNEENHLVTEEEVECHVVYDSNVNMSGGTEGMEINSDVIVVNVDDCTLYDSSDSFPTTVSTQDDSITELINFNSISGKSLTKKRRFSETSDGSSNDERSSMFPKIELTAEEKKLADKEGIVLPIHYPLTKAEERELKRIRRKIRNKKSAQNSRQKKKEYVDDLEKRTQFTHEENIRLRKKMDQLEKTNSTLVKHVKKLQAALQSRRLGQTQTTQPVTSLFVLAVSLALILAPSVRDHKGPTSSSPVAAEEGSENTMPLHSGQSRTLLYSDLDNSVKEDMPSSEIDARVNSVNKNYTMENLSVMAQIMDMVVNGTVDVNNLSMDSSNYEPPEKKLRPQLENQFDMAEAMGQHMFPEMLMSQLGELASRMMMEQAKDTETSLHYSSSVPGLLV